MAAGEIESEAVARGVDYLRRAPRQDGKWDEELYNAVGFPRVFYLRYHGYSAYFPLWALARYRDLMGKNDRRVAWGYVSARRRAHRSERTRWASSPACSGRGPLPARL